MAAIITTTPDLAEVADLGSDYWYGKVIKDTTGAALTPTADEWGPLPLRGSFKLTPEVSENTKETEQGQEVISSTKEKWGLVVPTPQVGIKVLDTLPRAILGKLVLIVLELNSSPINGKHIYGACIGKLTKRPGIESKGSPEFSFQLYKCTAPSGIAVSLDADDMPNFSGDIATPVTLTIPNGQYIGLVEVDAV